MVESIQHYRLAVCINAIRMIYPRIRVGAEISGLAIVDGMVFIFLGNILVSVHFQRSGGPVHHIFSCLLIVDEFRRPRASTFRRDLGQPRLAPVYQVVRFPYNDAAAG